MGHQPVGVQVCFGIASLVTRREQVSPCPPTISLSPELGSTFHREVGRLQLFAPFFTPGPVLCQPVERLPTPPHIVRLVIHVWNNGVRVDARDVQALVITQVVVPKCPAGGAVALEGGTGNAAVLDLHCLDNSWAGAAPPSLGVHHFGPQWLRLGKVLAKGRVCQAEGAAQGPGMVRISLATGDAVDATQFPPGSGPTGVRIKGLVQQSLKGLRVVVRLLHCGGRTCP
mmetsp:Transcript_16526/g.29420  ORF Transcript_16526/g.29420 Transcript_16526/m.29420 type:complete len:228 (-) Transcript_16526:890-1573(-)